VPIDNQIRHRRALERREPGLIPVLRRRATDWCLRNGLPEEALEYSIAAGDAETSARLAGQLGIRRSGRAGSPPFSGGSNG